MKRTAKTIGITAILSILLCGAYLSGITQGQAHEIKTYMQVIPTGYLAATGGRFYNNYFNMGTPLI